MDDAMCGFLPFARIVGTVIGGHRATFTLNFACWMNLDGFGRHECTEVGVDGDDWRSR
jgi:hypothetical protein